MNVGGAVDRRHNAVREGTYRFAKASALNPQREKRALLPPRPDMEQIKEKANASGRRPADIWMPRWGDGGPAALDFAVTSGLRADELHHSATDHSHCIAEYESFKRSYLSTEQQCQEQGLQFIPMVLEAHGGSWGSAAKDVLKTIAREYANQTGVTLSQAVSDLTQRISTTLERENARAILRRLASSEERRSSINADAWRDDSLFDDVAPVDGSGDVVMQTFQ